MSSTIERASEQLAEVLSGLGRVNGDIRAAGQLLAMLGWDLPPGLDDIGLSQLDVTTVAARLEDLTIIRSREDATDLELAAAVGEVVVALAEAFAHVEDIVRSLQAAPEYLDATDIVDQFFPRLADLLVIHAFSSAVPGAVPVGTLLGVFEFTEIPADPAIFQVEHIRQIVRWDRFSPLLTDPTGVLQNVYGWGTTDFNGNLLLTNIGRVFEYLAADVSIRDLPRPVEEQIVSHPVPEADTSPAAQLFVSLDKGLGFDAFDVGATLYALRASAAGATDGGIGLSPYALGTTDTSFPLSDTLSFVMSASADLQGGLALILRAGRDPELLTGLIETPGSGSPAAKFGLALRLAAPAGERHSLFSAPGISFDAAAITAGVGVTAGAKLNPSLRARIEDGRILVAPKGADGFLASILPADGVTATVNLNVSWSYHDGLRIEGGAGLRTSLGLNRRIGPLQLDTLDLALTVTSDALTGVATIAGGVVLGPVTARVDSIGTAVTLRFKRGNFGMADLSVGFKPPSGVGLKIDSPVVTGGGVLVYDSERAQYGGIVQLAFTECGLSLKAIGLISTRLPGGAKGFSMIVIITAGGFKPVPLGLGFTLTAIGGLIAINRTFNEEAVRAGIKSHALERVLFPQDPIGHASQLISSLNSFFPAQKDSYLLGVLVQIEWGLSSPLKMQLALILELGRRTRLIVLGHLTLTLPREDHDIVRLNMDAVGVLDFDQHTAAVDAALYDSRLLKKFVLTGQMAMRLRWGTAPQFALSVGGFHPAFKPPAGFPALERIALSLSDSDNFRLRCEGYFALTSNTLQFGARAELMARAGGCSIQGEIGFDALIQFDPFMFVASFHASVRFKIGSRSLATISVEGELSGPRPLHVKGKASFSIFWCTFSVRFNRTLLSGEPPPRLESVRVMQRLTAALADARNWGGQLPEGDLHLVTLRERQLPKEGALQEVMLHPLGKLSVKQSVVPLGLEIAKFGAATPADARLFTIASVSVGSQSIDIKSDDFERVSDFFAPGEFLEMTDDEKLAAPSFELLTAGFSLNADRFILPPFGREVNQEPLIIEEPAISYETIIIADKKQPAHKPTTRTDLDSAQLDKQLRFGAAARSDVRRAGATKFKTAGVKNLVAKTGWVVVSAADRTRQSAPGIEAAKLVSYAEAFQALQQLKRENPALAKGLKIARSSESVN